MTFRDFLACVGAGALLRVAYVIAVNAIARFRIQNPRLGRSYIAFQPAADARSVNSRPLCGWVSVVVSALIVYGAATLVYVAVFGGGW